MRLRVLVLYFAQEFETYVKLLSSFKIKPSLFPFFVGKKFLASRQEMEEVLSGKDPGLDEVFGWLWSMSETNRYPEKRSDFLKEEMITSLERAKKEGEFLVRNRSQKL